MCQFNKKKKFENIEIVSRNWKKFVENNEVEKLLNEIRRKSTRHIIGIIAHMTSEMDDKSKKLIDFLEAEIKARKIESNEGSTFGIKWATVVIAASSIISLGINIWCNVPS